MAEAPPEVAAPELIAAPAPAFEPTEPPAIVPAAPPALVDPPPASVPAPELEPAPIGTPEAPHDPALRPAAAPAASRPTELRSELDSGRLVGITVATVEGHPIGLRELQDAVIEWTRANVPAGERLDRGQLNEVASGILEQLIDRELFIQEARARLLKSDKQRQVFQEFGEKQWREQEIPKLLRKYKVAHEFELRRKFEEQGRSLEIARQTYLKDTMSREYLHHQLQGRLARPELPQLWTYYQAHLAEFDRSEQVTWREIAIRTDGDPIGARKRTEAVFDRLRRGEDFDALARASSQGATAAKGGLWQTEPNASAIPAVNATLGTLPVGQTSAILEGPASFHIVRVEARRPAGPTPFVEVQAQIAQKLQEDAFRHEVEAYTKRLRSRAQVVYHYGDKADPARTAANAPRDAAATRVNGATITTPPAP